MDFNNQNPIFMQIADLIMDSILDKELQEGERIQSVRELAAHVQVNPNTVMRAFSYLQDQGVIHNQRGVGYFVSEEAFNKIRRLRKDEFFKEYLPELFRRMELLQINFDELRTHYQKG